jgi:1-acyl-sn-glycerol-3-phosphate acyltransferase
MFFLRSLFFNILYALWMPLIGIVLYVPALFIPRVGSHWVGRAWAQGVVFLLHYIMGIRYEIKGAEHLQRHGAALYAVKHLSAWETVMFWIFVDTPVYVLKQELTKMPVFGYYLRKKIACIAIDRSAGSSAIRTLISGTKLQLAAGRQVIIFPEGTRRNVGDAPDYHSGISAIYNTLKVPVIPVAHNAGLFWSRNAFIKKPGTITIEFLPPIEAGMERDAFMQRLQDTIENNTNSLLHQT